MNAPFIIEPRRRDVAGLAVGRLLPVARRRTVGPFIYFDHMGPAEMAPGTGIDVPPHPHINLATVTYLFEGSLVHRDSLGSHQEIVPGDINWMTAGSGIAHSERTGPDVRRRKSRTHGIQLWVALPKESEESDPEFHHHPGDTLPEVSYDRCRIRLLVGEAWGEASPVRTHSPMVYADAVLEVGGVVTMPDNQPEMAAYLVEGSVRVGAETFDTPRMLVFDGGNATRIEALEPTRMILLGGAGLDGPRFIWWNFVSSSQARIERAKRDWKEGRFPKVGGDTDEFVPLPE